MSQEIFDAVSHKHIHLGKPDINRPRLSVWPAADEDRPPAVITMALGPLMGQQGRYVDLMPDEARHLARILIETADLIDNTETASALEAAE